MNDLRAIRFWACIVPVCALLMVGCVSKSPTIAGGGTDVSNAKVSGAIVSPGGQPVQMLTVKLLPQNYNPLLHPDTLTDSEAYVGSTDSAGRYNFSNVKKNTYAVFAVSPDHQTSMFISNITVGNADTIIVHSDSLKKTGALFVALLPNRPFLPGAFLFVPGTDIYTRIPSTQSAVTVDHIPAGTLPSLGYFDYYSEDPIITVSKNIEVQSSCTTSAGTATCLLISANSSIAKAESLMIAHIGRTGLTVQAMAESAVSAADCQNKDLIIVSPLVNGASLAFLKTMAVPVISCQPATYPLLDLTGKIQGTDFTVYNPDSLATIPDSLKFLTVEMRDIINPISLGIAGTQVIETDSVPMIWAKPNDYSKLVVSVFGDISHIILFTYDIGAQMISIQAPARREGFSFHADAMVYFNALGWTLFENSVYWSLRMR